MFQRVLPCVLLPAVLVAGCEQASEPLKYETLAGRVAARQTDTGELSVRVGRPQGGKLIEQTVFCIVTKDSEIYVNDQFSTIEAIQANDAIELVGYRDPDPRQERFVVSFAYINRYLPAPPLPDLPTPTTQPREEK